MLYPLNWSRSLVTLNPRRSLRSRIGLAIAGITFLLSLVTSLVVGHTVDEQLRVHIGEDLAELAYQMTDKLDRGMFERYRDLQILSTLETFRQPNLNVAQERSLLEKLQSTYTDYAWIGLTDPQGVVLASTGGLLEGIDLSQRPWFIGGKKAPYIGDVHEAVKLAKLLPNPDGEPIRFVDIALPLQDLQGNFRGVLAAHLSWKWSEEVQRSLFRQSSNKWNGNLSHYNNLQMFIFSQDGTLLLSPPGIEDQPHNLTSIEIAQQGTNGYLVEPWSDGDRYLTGFARSRGYRDYPGLGWLVLVRVDTATAFAPAQHLEQRIFIWNTVVGSLFAVLGWFVAARLSNPMLAIASAAESIRQGNTTVKIPILQGKDEIANLSKSLHRLVSTLKLAEKDLKASNEQLQVQLTLSEAARQEREQAEESLRLSEENFRQLAENIQEVFWIADPQFAQIIYVSPAYELIWQRSIASLYADPQSWLEVIVSEDRDRVALALENSLHQELDIEYRIIQPHGEIRWIWDQSFPIRNAQGEVYRRARLTQDITERKQAEETRQALEQEKELNELKSRFVSMTSHEFRTPLGTILSSAELLERYQGSWLQAKKLTHLHRIQTAAKHMTEMLNYVLTLSKAEAGKLHFNPVPVNLVQFCQELIEQIQVCPGQIVFIFAGSKIDNSALFYLDEKLLHHILSNLLSNAIKYSPDGSVVKFTLLCQSDRVVFKVQDSGIGIPLEDQKRLFESFHRATNVGNIQGTGLGLTIVKKCVDLHQGEITADSQVGVGTTFTVTLPLNSLERSL